MKCITIADPIQVSKTIAAGALGLVNINDKSLQQTIQRHVENSQKKYADATEKLASGQNFTRFDPRPAERAIAEGLEYRVRSLTANKRNINDAVSLLQTADGALSQINDMVLRMKEINIAASNTTVNDRERRFLFVEYEALHDEVSRVAESTLYNGIPLLNGKDERAPDRLIFRVDDPFISDNADNAEGDLNAITFEGFKNIVATSAGLGIRSARELLADSGENDGISLDDAYELLAPEDDTIFATVYDEAINALSTQRAVYGAMQTRMQRAMDFNDVFQENISAAKSNIADTDYASEVSRLSSAKILMQAGTAVLAQTNMTGQLTASLLHNLLG